MEVWVAIAGLMSGSWYFSPLLTHESNQRNFGTYLDLVADKNDKLNLPAYNHSNADLYISRAMNKVFLPLLLR